MFEEHSSSFSSPYLFNGKELDRETNLSYYGARYLDMKTSLWLSVDPLALYNPTFEDEFYFDGDHNNGIYNGKNLNVYGYCYQNPVLLVDPNGKQNVAGALTGALIGAVIGGGLDYGKQVYNNYQKGLSFKASLTTNINTRSIVASATEGAINGAVAGFTSGGSLLLSTGKVAVSQAAGGVVGGMAKRKINKEEVFNAESMLTDGVAGLVSGGISNQLEKKVASRVVAENIGNKLVREVVKKAVKATVVSGSRALSKIAVKKAEQKIVHPSN